MLPARDPTKPIERETPRIHAFVRRRTDGQQPDHPWTVSVEFDGQVVAYMDVETALRRGHYSAVADLADEDDAVELAAYLMYPWRWYEYAASGNGNTIVAQIQEASNLLERLEAEREDLRVVARFL